jgi:hypothetical protein
MSSVHTTEQLARLREGLAEIRQRSAQRRKPSLIDGHVNDTVGHHVWWQSEEDSRSPQLHCQDDQRLEHSSYDGRIPTIRNDSLDALVSQPQGKDYKVYSKHSVKMRQAKQEELGTKHGVHSGIF